VAKRLVPETKRVLVQRPDDSERERDAILGALRGAFAGDALLLAVCGGAFAEGVDYPNGALRAVAVIGPALPALSPERELLRAWFEERFERGFEHAYVVPGMTRVVQAAGRLIRSERDRGVIALFDHRFLEPPFCDLLPPEWVPRAGVEALAGDPVAVAREFFAPE
jgi:Rad3-related DNA helicase